MKNLTCSVYTFSDLIENNFLYIDKTEYIWKMVSKGKSMHFLSRPRRFGKSLTLSTFEAVFQGRKDLFKGLAIYDKPYDWKTYPIIHFDFAACDAVTPEQLEVFLLKRISMIAADLKIELDLQQRPSAAFTDLVSFASKRGRVVILVDEYDKPILGNVLNPHINEILKVLKGFYSVIKATESLQRFVFMTGVSKFSHVSAFSDLNNLDDITINPNYAAMLGYTQEEVEHYFAEYIDDVVERKQIPREKLLAELKLWYDGYKFSQNAPTVYNPVSLARFFENDGEFQNFWFKTGTPTFLLELARKNHFDFEAALKKPISAVLLDAYEVDKLDPLLLLFQTGYLTIKRVVTEFNRPLFYLGFPNLEVRSSFNTYLINDYTSSSRSEIESISERLAAAVRDARVDDFMNEMKSFLANIPYDIHVNDERYYQTIFFALFMLLGIYIEAESRTNDGRIDAVAKYAGNVYLFEFKRNQSEETALSQIHAKEYYRKYLCSGDRIWLIGVNFDYSTGQISGWKTETMPN